MPAEIKTDGSLCSNEEYIERNWHEIYRTISYNDGYQIKAYESQGEASRDENKKK
jgi:hypothetical protein